MNNFSRGTIKTRVTNRMKLHLKFYFKETNTPIIHHPDTVFIKYCEVFKIDITSHHKHYITNKCVEWFFEEGNKFYHSGSKGKGLRKLIEVNKTAPLNPPNHQSIVYKEKKLPVTPKEKEKLGYREKYKRYLRSAKWKDFKKELIKTRGHKCEKCGEKYRPLDGHHVTYERLYNELPEDVMLVCRECHKKEHNRN